jgi:hypothetical protein
MAETVIDGNYYRYDGSTGTTYGPGSQISWTEAQARVGSGKDVYTKKQADAEKLAERVIAKPSAWQCIEDVNHKGYFRSFAPQKYGEIYFGGR